MAKSKKRKTKICGAETRKKGLCQQPAMKNGRCYYHGGTSTGPPQGSRNAAVCGIYSDCLLPEETEYARQAIEAIGKVENELVIARVMLRRCVLAQTLWLQSRGLVEERLIAGKSCPEFYNLESVELEILKGEKGSQIKKRMLRRKEDFSQHITRWLRTISKLEITRAQLLSAATERGLDASVLAEELRAFGDMALLTVPATE